MSWKHGDFGLNPEHPPLVKLIAALPLLHLPVKMPARQNRFFKLEGFLGGKEFFFSNDADGMLFRARLAVSFFAVLLAVLVFLAAKEMFGTWAGFIALALLAFDPNFLAHDAVVGTDTGLACFRFASIYAFYRYVRAPSAGRLVVAALATGLATSTKHTAILLFPMLALLAVCEILRRDNTADGAPSEAKGKRAIRLAGAPVLITVISVGMLWSFYGFRYEPRVNHLAMESSLRAIREVAVAADRGLAAFHCRAFSFAARVLPLRIGRRAKHVGFLYQLCIRENLSEGRVVLFPGGLRDQVQPEFPDFAAAGNLGDGGEEIEQVLYQGRVCWPCFRW
jgi:hypothetical protein